MAILTTAERLEQVQTAISEILLYGQTYAIGGRAHSRADLKTLYDQENKLSSMLQAETYGRTRNLARFDDPV